MKKLIALTLLITAALGLFAGCANAPAAQSSEKELLILSDSLQEEEYGIAFKKDNKQLHDAVMGAFNAMIADGKGAEISKKWFGKDTMLPVVAADAAEYPEGKKDFIVGLDASFPPMGYTEENGDIVGFDIDLAKEVCARLGVELKLQAIDWATKEMELSSGKIDCIWNGLTITDERKESMLVSAPYLANRQVIVVAGGSDIKDRAGLEGKTVGVQTDSSGEEALAAEPVAQKLKGTVQFADYVSALQDLKLGRIDAVVVDEVVANYYVSAAK